MRSKYADIVPGDFEMAVFAQNATDQFTDPALTPLNSEDAMDRYQLQLMKTSTPEIRIPMGEDKVASRAKRAHSLITTMYQGGPRGPTEQAYKPEIVQSNASTFTYAVPSTDPVVASRNKSGTYVSDASGNTIYRLRLPNNVTNAEVSTRMFNFNNRVAKYANVKRQENTSQIVDWLPGRKDRLWGSRALDEYRHRVMPRIEDIDNGDNVNREKNTCRDTEKVAYRYRHKEYDVDRQLHEILDNNNRVMPEVSSTEDDGTAIGNLVAALARKGMANVNTGPDIYYATTELNSRRAGNPNSNSAHIGRGNHKGEFNSGLPTGDDKDGTAVIARGENKVNTEAIRAFKGMDRFKKELIVNELIDDIRKIDKKTKVKRRRKDTKNNNTTFDRESHTVDEENNNDGVTRKETSVISDDTDRKVFQIPISQYIDKISILGTTKKPTKKSGKGKGHTTQDYDFIGNTDRDNERVTRLGGKIEGDTSQNVRGLINEIMPVLERKSTDPRTVYNKNKTMKLGTDKSMLFTTPGSGVEPDLLRAPLMVKKLLERPSMPSGITLNEQAEMDGITKKPTKKRNLTNQQTRDDGLF